MIPSKLYNGNPYTGTTASLYWHDPQLATVWWTPMNIVLAHLLMVVSDLACQRNGLVIYNQFDYKKEHNLKYNEGHISGECGFVRQSGHGEVPTFSCRKEHPW